MSGSASQRLYTATELAGELGTTARALRFYETKGLLAPRRAGNRRVYDHRDRGRLNLILRGKRLGFSLAEIGSYLDLYDADPHQAAQLGHLHRAVSARIASLEEQRAALELTLVELEDIRRQTDAALTACGEGTRTPAGVSNIGSDST